MKNPHHVVPPTVYYRVFAALLVLLVLTVLAAEIDLGVFSPVVALLIATSKAVLIILFFMHVYYASPLTQAFAVGGFVWLAILLILLLSDVIPRQLL